MPRHSYLVSPQGSGPPPPPPIVRRWKPGWGTALNSSQVHAGPGGAYTGIPNTNNVNSAGPVAPGTQAIVAVHAWAELEPNGLTDPPGTGPGQRFSGIIPIVGNEIAQCATFANPSGIGPNNPVLYILRIIVKTANTFGGKISLPGDMIAPGDIANSYSGTATGAKTLASPIVGGWEAWRWNSTIVARYHALCAQINALYANNSGVNIYFGGIMTQETATSYTPTPSIDGYSDASYQAALIAECASIVSGSSVTRPYMMINDWPTVGGTTVPQGTFFLAQAVSACHQYGAIIGFPDLATMGSVPGRYYALIKACHDGGTFTNSAGSVVMPGPFGTYGSIQPSEWGGKVGPGDPTVSIPNLFNYATSSYAFKKAAGGTQLNDPNFFALDWSGNVPGQISLLGVLDIMLPDWHTADTSTQNPPQIFNPVVATMIPQQTQFGTVTPNP